MHAYLILGDDTNKVEEEILKIRGSKNSNVLNFPVQKISDVHELRKTLKVSQSDSLFVKLSDFNKATPEAQNAFLKNLEEPPNKVTFILISTTESGILPTIFSRCQIIKTQNIKVDDDGSFKDFYNADIFGKVSIIENIKKREEALEFVKKGIYELHSRVRENKVDKKAKNALKAAEKTLYALGANGNVYLQLLNFAIKVN